MDGLDEKEEQKEEKKPEYDATHIDEYGMVVTKENLSLIQGKITKLLKENFTVRIQATRQKDFKLE